MNAVESYPPIRPVFSRTVTTMIDASGAAVATPAADMLKNDFQNAIHRNLQSWVHWRTQLNDNLVDTVLTGRRMAEMEPIAACLDREAPLPGHPTNNPKTLLTFSASANSSTPLRTDEFYKYGIPRARITPQLHQHRHRANDDRDIGNSIPLSTSSAPELVGKRHHSIVNTATVSNCHRVQVDVDAQLSDDDEELVLDYFNFNNPPSAENKLAQRRRFHRSAATLPTVPNWSDKDTAGSSGSRAPASVSANKSNDRRRGVIQDEQLNSSKSVPSFAAPFSRQRMITARRDDVMYANHWQQDEMQDRRTGSLSYY